MKRGVDEPVPSVVEGIPTLRAKPYRVREFSKELPDAAWVACGLARSPIGPIRATPLGRLLLERGIREVIEVGQAHGIPLGENEIPGIMQFCYSLPATNKPSLLRDLEAGRPTEIEDLSGAVSRLGRLVGIETPIHDTATAAISAASITARQEDYEGAAKREMMSS